MDLTIKDLNEEGVAYGAPRPIDLFLSKPHKNESLIINRQYRALQNIARERSKSMMVPVLYRDIFKHFAQTLGDTGFNIIRGPLPARTGTGKPYVQSFHSETTSFFMKKVCMIRISWRTNFLRPGFRNTFGHRGTMWE